MMAEKGTPLIVRLMEKVEDTRDCWNWVGAKNHKGYGSFSVEGKTRSAYKVSYELFTGKVPEGLQLDHLCRNKACINPEHLEIVTGQENMRRWTSLITHCPKGHEYTPDNLRKRKNRACKTCHRIMNRQAYCAKKQV